jgi:SAM-dependent methyltransferase
MVSSSSGTTKKVVQEFWHRLVGVRGAVNLFPDQFSASSSTNPTSNFGTVYYPQAAAVQHIAKHRLVFLGEIHSMPPIVAFQRQVQAAMIQELLTTPPTTSSSMNQGRGRNKVLHVIMEHFSFEHQDLLDEYCNTSTNCSTGTTTPSGKPWTFDEFVQKYHELGHEGHDLYPYQALLEDAAAQTSKDAGVVVKVHAGFIPRRFAKMLIQEGPEKTLNEASKWLPSLGTLHGTSSSSSSFHYNVFESLLTGRSIYHHHLHQDTADKEALVSQQQQQQQPTDQFRRIFEAQVLKDLSMAHKINTLIEHNRPDNNSWNDDDNNSNNDNETQEKFLVIAGNGHLLHYCGVPERVLGEHPELALDACLVISEPTTRGALTSACEQLCSDDCHLHLNKDDSDTSATAGKTTGTANTLVKDLLEDRFGIEGSNPADYILFYEQPDEDLDEYQVKEETQKAYDKVGESAGLPGNTLKAAWIMYNMGYSEEQFQIAGSDTYNFQGVGNPHSHAKIQPGDKVLDIGSGLGIDSFIACSAAGPDGHVIGIDLSAKQVKHAQSRARERGISNLEFRAADLEKIPLPDESIDVIISNGAFCLAPNKRKAFAELFRVLRPGGRISICTTTTQVDHLEIGVSWPLCMKMFIAKKDLEPLVREVGFSNILVDDSDSSMTMEIPEEVLLNNSTNPNRNRVHVGGDDFKHLEDFDMDQLCARVCVVAEKPSLGREEDLSDSRAESNLPQQ